MLKRRPLLGAMADDPISRTADSTTPGPSLCLHPFAVLVLMQWAISLTVPVVLAASMFPVMTRLVALITVGPETTLMSQPSNESMPDTFTWTVNVLPTRIAVMLGGLTYKSPAALTL